MIAVPLIWYPKLLNASPKQRKTWRIADGGYGIHWPEIDEDLSAEGLLRGHLLHEGMELCNRGHSRRSRKITFMSSTQSR